MQDTITKLSTYDIRYTEATDREILEKWLLDKKTRLWYPPDSPEDVKGFVANWIGFSRWNASLTALFEGKPVGIATIYLMPYRKVAHTCMMYFVVAPEARRKGVGFSLLRNIKHLAKTRFKLESMHCEVFDGCAAISLFERAEFKNIIRQEAFVDFPEGPRARLIYESML